MEGLLTHIASTLLSIRVSNILRAVLTLIIISLIQSPSTALATADAAAINADIAKKLAASVKRGRNVYQQRAGCTECHLWNGNGQDELELEPLFELALNKSEIEQVIACGILETNMWSFNPTACLTPSARGKDAPKFISGRDLVDVANYVAEILAKEVTKEECSIVNGPDASICTTITN